MTICIAAIAADRSAVVVASDRMLSAGFLSLEFDHPRSKLERLGHTCVGMSAGDALPVGQLFASAKPVATQLQSPQIQHIAEEVKKAYCNLRAKRIQESVFQPRGITIEEFYRKGLIRQLPTEVAMSLDDMVQRRKLGIDLIVTGVDQNGAQIFGISDPGVMAPYDRIGYHAIGSGLSHAILSLVGAGQDWSTSVNETVFNVYRAKRQAELAPGVGESVEMQVISSGGTRELGNDEILNLKKILQKTTAPQNKTLAEHISKLGFDKGAKDGQAKGTE